jgi:GNAT superfamily N-acetyltransferase
MAFRDAPRPGDIEAVRALARATGFFRSDEIEVAAELPAARIAEGSASGYHFRFADADADGALLGYACFGPVPCTVTSFDLYWIVVDPEHQGKGLGRALMAAAEDGARALGGRRMYVETSTTARYAPTRRFYATCGYRLAATLEHFYDEGDGKAIYEKDLYAPDAGRPLT